MSLGKWDYSLGFPVLDPQALAVGGGHGRGVNPPG